MFESLMAFLHSLQGWPAYALVFGILVGSGFGLPMNEDILLVTAAALTLSGVMAPWPLIAVAWCGLLIADGLVFHWGRVFGARLIEHRWLAHAIPPRRLAAMQAFMSGRIKVQGDMMKMIALQTALAQDPLTGTIAGEIQAITA